MAKTTTKPSEKKIGTNTKERCNIVHLAGEIKKISVREDSAFLLVESGPEKKFIPCTVFKSESLASRLTNFEAGDTIQLVGYVRPWSQKDDSGEWKNNIEVRITEIRSNPPRRESQNITDDDILF